MLEPATDDDRAAACASRRTAIIRRRAAPPVVQPGALTTITWAGVPQSRIWNARVAAGCQAAKLAGRIRT